AVRAGHAEALRREAQPIRVFRQRAKWLRSGTQPEQGGGLPSAIRGLEERPGTELFPDRAEPMPRSAWTWLERDGHGLLRGPERNRAGRCGPEPSRSGHQEFAGVERR